MLGTIRETANCSEHTDGCKGGPKKCTDGRVTLWVTPDPVPAWGTVYQVNGKGFRPGAALNFVLGGTATFVVSDADGYASSTWRSWNPGTYTASAKEYIRKGYQLVASVTFEVK